MDTNQLRTHFGGVSNAVRAIGVSRQSFYDWEKRGAIPEDQQINIQRLTAGELKADEEILARLRELVGQGA